MRVVEVRLVWPPTVFLLLGSHGLGLTAGGGFTAGVSDPDRGSLVVLAGGVCRRLVPLLSIPQVVCGSRIDGVSAVTIGVSATRGALGGVGCLRAIGGSSGLDFLVAPGIAGCSGFRRLCSVSVRVRQVGEVC